MYKFIKITDGIAEVKAMFPMIEENKFNELIKLDPTYKDGVNSVGTYGKWVLNLYKKGKLKEEDFYKVTEYLKEFELKKKGMSNKDINFYKSLPDLYDALQDVGEIEKSKSQVKREIKNSDITKEAKLEFQSENWRIYIPLTYEASCKLGANTSWCTASNSSDYYYNYYSKQDNLYILINNNGTKYQFHFASGQFMDSSDRQINVKNFIVENEELRPWLKPKFGFNKEKINVRVKMDDIVDRLSSKEFDNETIRKIYNYEHYDMFYFDGYYGDVNRLVDDLDNDNKSKLKELDLDVTNIPDVESYALYAEEEGAAEECYNDLIKAIEQAIDDNNGVVMYEAGEAEFDLTFDDFLEIIDECEEEYDFTDKKEIILEAVNMAFEFREPYYGWNGFSKDKFNDDIYEALSDIENGNIEPEFDDDEELEAWQFEFNKKKDLENAKKDLKNRQISFNLDSKRRKK